MDLTVRTEHIGGVVVARVAGDLDVATEAEFLRRVGELGLDEASCVVVDLSDMTFLDAHGMAAVVQLAQQINDHLGWLALVTRPRGRRQLNTSRLDQLIPVFDTVDEGLAWIRVHRATRPHIPASSFGRYLLTLGAPPLSKGGPALNLIRPGPDPLQRTLS